MKSLIQAVVVSAVLAAPIASFAQSNPPVTRAQVRAELVQLENAGYNPSRGADPQYPADVQAAEARVATRSGATSGFGGMVSGSSRSGATALGRSTENDGMKPIYFGQ